jgi:hypothetical protein
MLPKSIRHESVGKAVHEAVHPKRDPTEPFQKP